METTDQLLKPNFTRSSVKNALLAAAALRQV